MTLVYIFRNLTTINQRLDARDSGLASEVVAAIEAERAKKDLSYGEKRLLDKARVVLQAEG